MAVAGTHPRHRLVLGDQLDRGRAEPHLDAALGEGAEQEVVEQEVAHLRADGVHAPVAVTAVEAQVFGLGVVLGARAHLGTERAQPGGVERRLPRPRFDDVIGDRVRPAQRP